MIQTKREYNGHAGKVACCGFLNNEYFVTGSFDSAINLWEVEQQREIERYDDHQSEVVALDVFKMDGNVFVSGSTDLTFRLWDIRQKKACFRKFMENDCGVSSVKFMQENINTIAVGYENSSIEIWDLRALGKVGKLDETDEKYESVQSLAFSKSGRLLFASYNNSIKIWDLLSESKVGSFGDNVHNEVIKSISMNEDGSQLLAAGKCGQISQWTV